MTLPLGATWEQHLEWCEREIARLDVLGAVVTPLQAEAARCREEIIKAKGRER